jgi:hypothetical protein
MSMTYPTIDIEEFDKIAKLLEDCISDPKALDPAICPYDEAIVAKLRKLTNWLHPAARASVDPDKNPVGRPKKAPILPIDEVEKEVDEIRKEIAQLKIDAKGLETADRIQIIKTRATLVEKIIAMKERITNVKKQQKFISDVMALLEDVLEQGQREEFIKRLSTYLEE